MYSCTENQAVCRGCGTKLNGSPYYKGGSASLPNGQRAKVNYYGGWICSRNCDFRACLELEQSMPGHGFSQKSLGSEAMSRISSNWGE